MTIVRKFPRAKAYRRSAGDVKALVRFRDGYRCAQCGMTAKQHWKRYKKGLEVHRVIPGSKYTIKGCVTLCRKCHGPQPRSEATEHEKPLIIVRMKRKLLAAIDSLASELQRSRNFTMNMLIEEYLKAQGEWPPKS